MNDEQGTAMDHAHEAADRAVSLLNGPEGRKLNPATEAAIAFLARYFTAAGSLIPTAPTAGG